MPVEFVSVKSPNPDGADSVERNGKAGDVYFLSEA